MAELLNGTRSNYYMKRLGLTLMGLAAVTLTSVAEIDGWTNWRGPHQSGRSDETSLPDKLVVSGPEKNLLWTHEIAGRGSVVTAGDKFYFR